MSFRKSYKSYGQAACAMAIASSVAVSPVHAGPLCDWLCGRTPPTTYPVYAAGYPVVQAPVAVQSVGFASPIGQSPVVMQSTGAPLPTPVSAWPNGYASNYAPTNRYVSTSPPVSGSQNAPAVSFPAGTGYPGAIGANALQMPSYAGYYGASPATAPGDRGYAAVSPLPGQQLPASGIPTTSFYGTGNTYPTFPGTAQALGTSAASPYGVVPATAYYAPQSSYYAPQATAPVGVPMATTSGPAFGPVPGIQGSAPSGVPVSAPPGATVQTYPGIPASRPGLLGGLSRFFGGMFGTEYSSSYYRAPVTYYRPVTTVNPTTGASQTVQQACTSYEYQLQRTPTTSCCPSIPGMASTTPGAYGASGNCCSNNCGSGYNPYVAPATAPAPAAAFSQGTFSGVAPTNYYGPPVTTMPDGSLGTSPGLQGYSQSIAPQQYGAPLNSGSTSANGGTAIGSGVSNPDLAPVVQPELGPQRSSNYGPPTTGTPPLTAPSLIPPTAPLSDAGSSSSEAMIKPIPANGYPYQRPEGEQTPRLQLPPPPNEPIAASGGDRVATANSQSTWGYKKIQWQVRPATFQAPNPTVNHAIDSQSPVETMKSPVYLRSFTPTSAKEPAATSGEKLAPIQYEAYQRTGWTRSGR